MGNNAWYGRLAFSEEPVLTWVGRQSNGLVILDRQFGSCYPLKHGLCLILLQGFLSVFKAG
ncbi:TPA: hypothetical protein ACYEKW_004808 [Escherichia coli]